MTSSSKDLRALNSRTHPCMQSAQPDSPIAVLFHSLYRNSGELSDSALAPNQGVNGDYCQAAIDARHQCRKFSTSFVPSNALRTLIYSRYSSS